MQGQHRHRGGMLHEHERSSTSPAASPCIAWVCPCPAVLPPQGTFPSSPPRHHPPPAVLSRCCLLSRVPNPNHEGLGGVGGSEMPHPCAARGWQPVLGGTHPTIPSPAREELSSVAAALLNDHVLVVADDDFALLVVEHGEGAHPDGRAGRARHLVGLIELQQALRGHGKGTASAPCPVPPGWAAGARGNGGSGGSRTPLTCM